MASFVRESRFRNTAVTVNKREQHYEALHASSSSSSGCELALAASSSLFAYTSAQGGGGSAVAVLPLTSTGKNHVPLHAAAYAQPLIRAHTQPVTGLAFDPFDRPGRLYSCSNDGSLKAFDVPAPEGLVADLTAPVITCRAAGDVALKGLAPHQLADGLVACRGARGVVLFDVSSASPGPVFETPAGAVGGDIHAMGWSYDGALLALTAKDKRLYLVDPRQADAVVAAVPGHANVRPSAVQWLNTDHHFVTCGHGAAMEREWILWDARKLITAAGASAGGDSDRHVARERIDASISPLTPLFDPDTGLLVLAGRGDTTARLYEYAQGALHAVSNTPLGAETIRAVALLPKRACNVAACEVLRVLKLCDDTVQPVSFTVPRRDAKLVFQSDLYPPTHWEAPAALTAGAWLGGDRVAAPRRVPIDPPGGGSTSTKSIETVGSITLSTAAAATTATATADDAAATTADADTDVPVNKALLGLGSSQRFRHITGTHASKTHTYFNLRPSASPSDGPGIACSTKYWAIPYQGSGGGPVYVSRHSAYGKVEPLCPTLNAHKSPVTDVAFSPFRPGLLATGSVDSTVKVWTLPEDDDADVPAAVAGAAAAASFAHGNSIRSCLFHPTVENMLVTAALDMTVRLFDVAASAEMACCRLGGDASAAVANFSFNLDGSVAAVACRDRTVRFLDLRSGQVVATAGGNSSTATQSSSSAASTASSTSTVGRNLRVEWCSARGGSAVVTASATSSGTRALHCWDPRALHAPVCARTVDQAAGQLFPMYDEATGLCCVVGKGDKIVRFYELNFLAEAKSSGADGGGNGGSGDGGSGDGATAPGDDSCPDGTDRCGGAAADKCAEFPSHGEPFAGVCLLPSRLCDVRRVEVLRLLKLAGDTVAPISFTVPRAEHLKSYFQDDLYRPVRSATPGYTVADYNAAAAAAAAGSHDPSTASAAARYSFPPATASLRPADLPSLSERSAEEAAATAPPKGKNAQFREEIQQQQADDRTRVSEFSRLQALAVQRSNYQTTSTTAAAAAAAAAPARQLSRCVDATPIYDEPDSDEEDRWKD